MISYRLLRFLAEGAAIVRIDDVSEVTLITFCWRLHNSCGVVSGGVLFDLPQSYRSRNQTSGPCFIIFSFCLTPLYVISLSLPACGVHWVMLLFVLLYHHAKLLLSLPWQNKPKRPLLIFTTDYAVFPDQTKRPKTPNQPSHPSSALIYSAIYHSRLKI